MTGPKYVPWRVAFVIASALLLALGAGLALLPLGIVVLGLEGFATVYAVFYLESHK